MLINRTKAEVFDGLYFGGVDFVDYWSDLAAATTACFYLYENRGCDIRAWDPFAGTVIERWPFVANREFQESWCASDTGMFAADRRVAEFLESAGLLISSNHQDLKDTAFAESDFRYFHVNSADLARVDFAVPQWEPLQKLQGDRVSMFFIDMTDRCYLSLNAFVSGDLSTVMWDGRGCALAARRVFSQRLLGHQIAIIDSDDPWPFSTGSWADFDEYVDISEQMVKQLQGERTLIGDPNSQDLRELIHVRHKDNPQTRR